MSGRKKTKATPPRDRRTAWVLAVFLTALLLRVVLLLQLRALPYYQHLFSDALIYRQLAGEILSGSWGENAFFMSPVYPFLLAGMEALTGDMLLWTRILQGLLGAATAVLVLLLTTEIAGRAAGRLAGFLAAVNPAFLFYDNAILVESLLTASVTAFLFVLLRAVRDSSRPSFFFSGMLLGTAILCRSTAALFVPVLLVWLLLPSRRGKTRGGIAPHLAGLLLVIAPVTVHNVASEGTLIPVTSSAGFNFYAGNNPRSGGLYTVPEVPDLNEDLNGERYAERMTGRDLNSAGVSSFWFSRAEEWIRGNPGEYLFLQLRKLVLFFHPMDVEQQGSGPSFLQHEYLTILDLPLPGFAVLLLPAFFGMLVTARSAGKTLTLLFLASYVLATVLFFVNGRLRVPVTPLFILYASAGLVHAAVRLRARAAAGLALPAFASVGAFAALMILQPPVPAGRELDYNRLGQLAFNRGEYAQAESLFRRSLQEKPMVSTMTNLGNALAAQGETDEARVAYLEAMKLDSAYHLAYFNYGNLLLQAGKAEEALRTWQRCITLRPDFAPAYRNSGLLLARAGRFEAALRRLRVYLSVEKDPAKRAEIEREVLQIGELLRGERKPR